MRNYFPRLYGNEGTKNRIAAAIESGKLPHALLIDGDEGSGRMTLALEIAAALNCENRGDSSVPLPCGKCNCCRRIYSGGFADVSVLEREKGKASLGVDEVRLFRNDMFLSATESDYKVYIIKDTERMTMQAQNALLIVLEEPPPNVIIILLSAGTDKILTTIKSRVQYIAMSRFTPTEIGEYLCKNLPKIGMLAGTDRERFKSILLGADGMIGRAIQLASPDESQALEERRELILSFVRALSPRIPYSEMFRQVNSLPKERSSLVQMLEGITVALRDLIAIKRGVKAEPLFFTSRELASTIAKDLTIIRLVRIYDIILATIKECEKNANNSLLITNLGMKIKMA
ncbi:MAG: hypothetical protein IJY24_05425 [Clostridia bacterium]|nr:hypothetical protein [Clostridia bacterium]